MTVDTTAEGDVDVTVRVSSQVTAVTVRVVGTEQPQTVAIGGGESADDATAPSLDVGGRRSSALPPLIAVTDMRRLEANIGLAESRLVVNALHRSCPRVVLDAMSAQVPGDLLARVHKAAEQTNAQGVLIVGGYDVVPSFPVDALPTQVKRMRASLALDQDDWKVWTDDPYGELDVTSGHLLPVSRIPDGHSSELVLYALQADPIRSNWSGIRNKARPFVEAVAPEIEFIVSDPFRVDAYRVDELSDGRVYLMLHGGSVDASLFWGEDDRGHLVEALNVATLSAVDLRGSVVFAGCCWGALTVDNQAKTFLPSPPGPVAIRSPRQSMALTALAQGALAFVGCTGSHWSPGPDGAGYSRALHDGFWESVRAGQPPAPALRQAKEQLASYLLTLSDAAEIAVVSKTLRQFTCLGLGW